MTAKKKEKKQTEKRRILVMDFGRYEIVAEDERYFYCENTQFFKTNKHILEIVEEPAEAEIAEEKAQDIPEQREDADE